MMKKFLASGLPTVICLSQTKSEFEGLLLTLVTIAVMMRATSKISPPILRKFFIRLLFSLASEIFFINDYNINFHAETFER